MPQLPEEALLLNRMHCVTVPMGAADASAQIRKSTILMLLARYVLRTAAGCLYTTPTTSPLITVGTTLLSAGAPQPPIFSAMQPNKRNGFCEKTSATQQPARRDRSHALWWFSRLMIRS